MYYYIYTCFTHAHGGGRAAPPSTPPLLWAVGGEPPSTSWPCPMPYGMPGPPCTALTADPLSPWQVRLSRSPLSLIHI